MRACYFVIASPSVYVIKDNWEQNIGVRDVLIDLHDKVLKIDGKEVSIYKKNIYFLLLHSSMMLQDEHDLIYFHCRFRIWFGLLTKSLRVK